MESSIKSFFKYTAVIFFFSLFTAWSCTAVSEGEKVIQLDTYLIHAAENGKPSAAPIFPGEQSVNYIADVLENMDQIYENLKSTYGYEIINLKAQTRDFIRFQDEEQHLSAFLDRRNFRLQYSLINKQPVVSPHLFTHSMDGQKDLIHTRLNFVDDKTIVLGMGQPGTEKRSALFLVLHPKTITIKNQKDLKMIQAKALPGMTHQLQAYRLGREISDKLNLSFEKINDFENLFEFFEVTQKPKMIKKGVPKYPKTALKKGITGTVVTTIVIREDGTVGKALIFRSVDTSLDSAALAASLECRFSPGEADGKKVKTMMNIPFKFKLAGADENQQPWQAAEYTEGLTKSPQQLKTFYPELPEKFDKNLLPDVCMVMIKIDKTGKVSGVSIKRAAKIRELDKLSLEAAMKWEFIPGEVNGSPAETKVIVPFIYTKE